MGWNIEWKNLERVGEIIGQRGYRIVNVDSVVIAQRPKLSPYIEEMRLAIASALNVTAAQVSVKPLPPKSSVLLDVVRVLLLKPFVYWIRSSRLF